MGECLLLEDATGDGLFVAGKPHLNVSVHVFSTDNLSRALYPFQLVRQEGVTLGVHHRVSGVGGTPVRTLQKYRVLPGEFAYTIRLRPFSSLEISAQQLSRQDVFGD